MDLSTKPFWTKEYQSNFKIKKKKTLTFLFLQSNSFQRELFLTVSLLQSLSILKRKELKKLQRWFWVYKWNTCSTLYQKQGENLIQTARGYTFVQRKLFPKVGEKQTQWIQPIHFLMACIIKNITYAFLHDKEHE